MLVGEGPGAEEDKAGRPFVGQAGQVLDECLVAAGLERSKVYITNIVKCRPPGNRDPGKDEMAACIRYLIEEIETVKPKVIICVGRNSLKALTGEDAIGRARGRLLSPLSKLRVGSAKIIAMTHPAAYLWAGRNQAIKNGMIEDLKSAQKLIKPVEKKPSRLLLWPGKFSTAAFRHGLEILGDCTSIACDLEWTAPIPDQISWPWTPDAELLSISLSGRVNGKLKTMAFSWPLLSQDQAALYGFLATHNLIFHNAMADVIWLLSVGMRPKVGGDTMLKSYLLDEQRRASLKGAAPLTAGVEAGWEIKPWHRRPQSAKGWQELLTYNADDTENTLLLDEAQLEQLYDIDDVERRGNITRVYKNLLLPAIVPFARAALNGAPIDENALALEIKKHRALRNAAVAEIASVTGLRPDVAEKLAGSAQKIVRYCREAYGLEITSSQAEDLADYVDQYPALRAIQSYKHERKMLSTYLEPWQRLLDRQRDGRLHSIYLLGATRTGRLSADLEEGGSLLLTPRDDWMRNLIAAVDDEWEITSADYSQLELRLIAWLAPERTMRRLFNEGADLHATTAAYVKAGVPLKTFWKRREQYVSAVTKDERQAGKSHNFGYVFLMGDEHYVRYAKSHYGVEITMAESEKQHRDYFRLYSDLQPWHNRAVAEFQEKGYTVTPFGRYRFGLTDATQAVNTPIQTTGADLTILALTVIDERLEKYCPEDAFLIGFIHDAILVYHRKSARSKVHKIIKRSMEHPELKRVGIEAIPVPLVADTASGSSWAKAK